MWKSYIDSVRFLSSCQEMLTRQQPQLVSKGNNQALFLEHLLLSNDSATWLWLNRQMWHLSKYVCCSRNLSKLHIHGETAQTVIMCHLKNIIVLTVYSSLLSNTQHKQITEKLFTVGKYNLHDPNILGNVWYDFNTCHYQTNRKQAGAELCQAQLKLR